MSTSSKQIDQLFQSQLYLYFHENILTEERTKQECAFIEKCCVTPNSGLILDLACGHGRHTNILAKKGYEVTGVDINTDFLKIARTNAQKKGLQVGYIELDILQLNSRDQYDTVLLLMNTLGFFDRKDAKHLFDKIYQALKPGGKALIDTKNRDIILREAQTCSVTEHGEDLMIDRLSFDPKSGTTTNRRIYIKEGQRHDVPFSMTAYNFTDLKEMAEDTGFKIREVYGSWDGKDFDEYSKRIMLVLEK